MDKQHLSFEQLPSVVAEILDRVCFIQMKLDEAQTPDASPPEILNADGAADLLKVAKPTLYNLVSKRKIPHLKSGKRLLFYRSELLEHLNEGRRQTRDKEILELNTQVDSILNNASKTKKRKQ